MDANEREPGMAGGDAPERRTDEQASQERARLVERKQTIDRGDERLAQETVPAHDVRAPLMAGATSTVQPTSMTDQATMTWEDALAILSAPADHSPTIDSE